jgi:LysR family transcriptional regulator, glycine cleavage system transcriptional activator
MATPLIDRFPGLRSMRAFAAAGRLMSFSKAAEELGVTPAAISHQIKEIEDQLGVAVFLRTSRSMSLTREGEILLTACSESLEMLSRAIKRLKRLEIKNQLKVSASPSFAAKWLVPRLGAFEQAHPQVDVWLSAAIELVDLTAGEVDVAIRYGSGRYPGLEVRRLMSETVIPVISPDLLAQQSLESPADLKNHILLHDGSPDLDDSCPDWSMWLAARGVRGVDGNRGPRFNQSSLVIEAAVNGRGVALAKLTLAQADLDAGRLVAPLQITTAIDFAYYLVHSKAKGRLPQVKAFNAWLEAEAAAHEAALRAIDNGAGI